MTSPSWPPGGLDPLLETLQETYLPDVTHYDLAGLLNDPRLGRTAVVSSFGAESVVLLHYVNRVRPGTEVLFIDTGKHFAQTLAYRDQLVADFGLRIVNVGPDPRALASEDPYGAMFGADPNTCCAIRKVFPLQDAIAGYGCWISGRKRYQASTRANIPVLERDGAKIKINPLAMRDSDRIAAYIADHDLPPHPLESQGFPSIGCEPCTRAVRPGEDQRGGRWAGSPDKTECGIHLGPDGRFSRVGPRS